MEERFTKPDGFKWGSFTNKDGANIRYGHVKPKGESKGVMVLGPGFRETIEKYYEVMRDMLDRGFEVYAMDWRGQGGSDRYLPNEPQKAHHEGFDASVRDLKQFMDDVVKPDADKPCILNAHSMGGHIGLRFLNEHPGIFDSAIINAPMFAINTSPFPAKGARTMAQFAKAAGKMENFVPGAGPYEAGKMAFKDNRVTSDPVRHAVHAHWFDAKPEISVGEATFGWVYHAFQSMDVLNKQEYLEDIKTPVLMGIPLDDQVVDAKAAQKAATHIPDCETHEMPGAKHETWMEDDVYRAPWLKKVDGFLDKTVKAKLAAKHKPANSNTPRRGKKGPKFGP